MRIKTYDNARLEGGICEQFGYTPYLVGYPKRSDTKELGDMPCEIKEGIENV